MMGARTAAGTLSATTLQAASLAGYEYGMRIAGCLLAMFGVSYLEVLQLLPIRTTLSAWGQNRV